MSIFKLVLRVEIRYTHMQSYAYDRLYIDNSIDMYVFSLYYTIVLVGGLEHVFSIYWE